MTGLLIIACFMSLCFAVAERTNAALIYFIVFRISLLGLGVDDVVIGLRYENSTYCTVGTLLIMAATAFQYADEFFLRSMDDGPDGPDGPMLA